MSPTYSRNVLAISLLTGVKDAKLDGDFVTGHWQDELKRIRSKGSQQTIVEQFLNWSNDPQSICRFVQRFGPLSRPIPGTLEFRQSLKEWCARQAALQGLWRFGPSLGYKIGLREGEMLAIFPKELALEVPDLSRFLEFEIFSHPAARRRVCERPDCPNPYFIAAHLKTTLCSTICKAWKQRQHRLNWWRERGAEWRKSRKLRKKPLGRKGRSH